MSLSGRLTHERLVAVDPCAITAAVAVTHSADPYTVLTPQRSVTLSRTKALVTHVNPLSKPSTSRSAGGFCAS